MHVDAPGTPTRQMGRAGNANPREVRLGQNVQGFDFPCLPIQRSCRPCRARFAVTPTVTICDYPYQDA